MLKHKYPFKEQIQNQSESIIIKYFYRIYFLSACMPTLLMLYM